MWTTHLQQDARGAGERHVWKKFLAQHQLAAPSRLPAWGLRHLRQAAQGVLQTWDPTTGSATTGAF